MGLESVWNMSETSRKVSVTLTTNANLINLTYPNILLGPEILSNSNPTWNSTELELVEVGVDFVFQCHNNKKNKNNPHLILIYRKGLQVYNLGWVTVWVSRSCLEVVWKVSGRCLEIDWKVSGRRLEDVWKVSGRCLEPYLSYPYQPN